VIFQICFLYYSPCRSHSDRGLRKHSDWEHFCWKHSETATKLFSARW